MKAKFNIIRTDLYHVLVEGNGNKQEMARVFLMIFVPLYVLYTSVAHIH